MTIAEELASYEQRIADLKLRAAQEQQEVNPNTKALELIANNLAALKNEQADVNAATKYYPFWNPLRKGVDYGEGTGNWSTVIGHLTRNLGVTKAIASDYAGPLIRQDLEPDLLEVFVSRFPFWDMLKKHPANGLVHAWNNKTSYGSSAPFIVELGTVSDTNSVYERLTQNISIIANRVGVSLKAKFAVQAGGMGYDPEAEELKSAMQNLSHKAQQACCLYQTVDNTSTLVTSANGIYDANGFNGLRFQAQNFSPAANNATLNVTSWPPTVGTHPLTDQLQMLMNTLLDAGADPTNYAVITSYKARQYLIEEQTSFVRFNDPVEVKPGLKVPSVILADSTVPVFAIPGDSIGTWNGSGGASGYSYSDMFLVNMDQATWAYLGGPSPTIIDIPIGTNATLDHLYIPFLMGALCVRAPQYLARLSLRTV